MQVKTFGIVYHSSGAAIIFMFVMAFSNVLKGTSNRMEARPIFGRKQDVNSEMGLIG